MKKFLSISFSFLILLSVMHITIATHYCGSKYAASKVSLSGELASCGMEGSVDQCQLPGKHITSHCCTDKISVFTVENNYAPSFFEFKVALQNLLQAFNIPANYKIQPLFVSNLLNTNVHPPGCFLVSDVSLPNICVFRI